MLRQTLCYAGVLALAGGLTVAAPMKVKPASGGSAGGPTVTGDDAGKAHRMEPVRYRPRDLVGGVNPRGDVHSAARIWNEMLLFAIRRDLARPTVHARNLYHISGAMYDAWAAYDAVADQILHQEKLPAPVDVEAARAEAISFAAYRMIQRRFLFSPGAFEIYNEMDALMDSLGYNRNNFSTVGDTPAALGNRIADAVYLAGFSDGSNEQNNYGNQQYVPLNPPLLPEFAGNPDIIDPNRWQPLALQFFVDQNGNPIPGGYPPFLSPEWGNVTPFSLREQDLTIRERDGFQWKVWHDPGHPPYINEPGDLFKWGFELVSVWSGQLDPTDGVMWDVSPNRIGNQVTPPAGTEQSFYNLHEGGDQSLGYDLNPVTGEPYPEQIVPRGDYARILAEFWADGPNSETPPGHWFTILNYVLDHPAFEYRWKGQGPIVDTLEFDVKSYVALGGMMHDVAISAWSVKGFYDYVRPVSVIRYLCDQGQSSDPQLPRYHPNGVNLIPGCIELVTAETTAPGERHEHLAGGEGKIAVYAWRGHPFIEDPDVDVAGVGWILAENWWPYQRPSFVTPPFAGYVSGHSTYSRAAAELMTLLTGSPYFPAGLGEFHAPQNEYLVFEEGPSVDVYLQWASYNDASDQCSLSRIWGGIHPPADDLPGRHIGKAVGPEAFFEAERYFNGQKSCPADFTQDGMVTVADIAGFVETYQSGDMTADLAEPFTVLNFYDVIEFVRGLQTGCP